MAQRDQKKRRDAIGPHRVHPGRVQLRKLVHLLLRRHGEIVIFAQALFPRTDHRIADDGLIRVLLHGEALFDRNRPAVAVVDGAPVLVVEQQGADGEGLAELQDVGQHGADALFQVVGAEQRDGGLQNGGGRPDGNRAHALAVDGLRDLQDEQAVAEVLPVGKERDELLVGPEPVALRLRIVVDLLPLDGAAVAGAFKADDLRHQLIVRHVVVILAAHGLLVGAVGADDADHAGRVVRALLDGEDRAGLDLQIHKVLEAVGLRAALALGGANLQARDELLAVALVQPRDPQADRLDKIVDQDVVVELEGALRVDLKEHVFLREGLQKAGEVLRRDRRLRVFDAGAEEVLALLGDAEGLILARRAVFGIAVRLRVDGVDRQIFLGKRHDARERLPLPPGRLQQLLLLHLSVDDADAHDDLIRAGLQPRDLHVGVQRRAEIRQAVSDGENAVLVQIADDALLCESG